MFVGCTDAGAGQSNTLTRQYDCHTYILICISPINSLLISHPAPPIYLFVCVCCVHANVYGTFFAPVCYDSALHRCPLRLLPPVQRWDHRSNRRLHRLRHPRLHRLWRPHLHLLCHLLMRQLCHWFRHPRLHQHGRRHRLQQLCLRWRCSQRPGLPRLLMELTLSSSLLVEVQVYRGTRGRLCRFWYCSVWPCWAALPLVGHTQSPAHGLIA